LKADKGGRQEMTAVLLGGQIRPEKEKASKENVTARRVGGRERQI